METRRTIPHFSRFARQNERANRIGVGTRQGAPANSVISPDTRTVGRNGSRLSEEVAVERRLNLVLPIKKAPRGRLGKMVGRTGFEPVKA